MEIEVISYVSCLPHNIRLSEGHEWNKPDHAIERLRYLNSFLQPLGFATNPKEVAELFKEGGEIEPVARDSYTPSHFLMADLGLEYFKKNDVLIAYNGAMLEIRSSINVIDTDQAINAVESMRRRHVSVAENFCRTLSLHSDVEKRILLGDEYLT
jgi:hypothetical protein